MAGNKRRKLKFSLFPLFPRFQAGRLKSRADTSKLKNKEVLRDEGEPSCSQTRKKRKLWRIRIEGLLRNSLDTSVETESEEDGIDFNSMRGSL
ncbi:hypothetical protein SUGI_0342910 [Cryptomeria japonica]|nr:hypothetical protein SUGI_0342910 [Cryptomeria japonica]